MSGRGASELSESSSGEVWEDLIIAMLAVGGFSVRKVLEMRGSLAGAGLLEAKNLVAWDAGRVTRELNSAGYSRGMLTGMYAERLVTAIGSLADRLEENAAVLLSDDSDQIAALLLPQHGIGPKVVETYLTLRRRQRSGSK